MLKPPILELSATPSSPSLQEALEAFVLHPHPRDWELAWSKLPLFMEQTEAGTVPFTWGKAYETLYGNAPIDRNRLTQAFNLGTH